VNDVFVLVFSIFILALVVLISFTLRWAFRSDRANWRRTEKKD
jgi:RsiW-degrading membrane proteinase PrsW (M82 family)